MMFVAGYVLGAITVALYLIGEACHQAQKIKARAHNDKVDEP